MARKVNSQKLKVKSSEKNDSQTDVQVLRKELAGLRLEHSQFKLKNTRSIFLTRNKLARALTQQTMQRKEEVKV